MNIRARKEMVVLGYSGDTTRILGEFLKRWRNSILWVFPGRVLVLSLLSYNISRGFPGAGTLNVLVHCISKTTCNQV